MGMTATTATTTTASASTGERVVHHTEDRHGAKIAWELEIRQQPRQARMCGSGEKADRRPIDPPPIVRLRVRRLSRRVAGTKQLEAVKSDFATPTKTHTLFMFASLVPEDSDEELYVMSGSKSRHVVGSVVSSLYHLKDPIDHSPSAFFVFPDLGVRSEGTFRFKMCLYELTGEAGAQACGSIFTQPFTVYSPKRFPGMSQSTELSRSFASQGFRMRIRRPFHKDEDGATADDAQGPEPSTSARSSLSPDDDASMPAAKRRRSENDMRAHRPSLGAGLLQRHSATAVMDRWPHAAAGKGGVSRSSAAVAAQRMLSSLPTHGGAHARPVTSPPGRSISTDRAALAHAAPAAQTHRHGGDFAYPYPRYGASYPPPPPSYPPRPYSTLDRPPPPPSSWISASQSMMMPPPPSGSQSFARPSPKYVGAAAMSPPRYDARRPSGEASQDGSASQSSSSSTAAGPRRPSPPAAAAHFAAQEASSRQHHTMSASRLERTSSDECSRSDDDENEGEQATEPVAPAPERSVSSPGSNASRPGGTLSHLLHADAVMSSKNITDPGDLFNA